MSPFGIRPRQRVAVFIDGVNIYHTAKLLGWEVNYKALRQHFEDNSDLYRMFYFTTLPDFQSIGNEEQHNPVIKLVDWLSYNQYRCLTKAVPVVYDNDGRQRVRGSMYVEMAVEMMEAVMTGAADHLVLFGSSSEFSYAIEAVQRRGATVTVASSLSSSKRSDVDTPIVSDELRRTADRFIDVNDTAVRDIMANIRANPRNRDVNLPVTLASRTGTR